MFPRPMITRIGKLRGPSTSQTPTRSWEADETLPISEVDGSRR